jgi:anti-sigma regulatory factor (Ser/Thr protein kinase)
MPYKPSVGEDANVLRGESAVNAANREPDRTLALQLAARPSFLSVVTGFVDSAARAFGMGREETLKIGLAAEEIFSFACERICPGKPVDIRCLDGKYFMGIAFRFPVSALDMGALNITASARCDREEDLAETGLVLASRSVDRLRIDPDGNDRVRLSVEKDKSYPPAPEGSPAPAVFRGTVAAAAPDGEALKRYVVGASRMFPGPLLPDFFRYPGKVVDMAAAGDVQAVVAADETGRVAGGILFRFLTERVVEILGPHVFDPSRTERISADLLDACIARTARTKAIGLVSLTGLPGPVRSQFESLGALTLFEESGRAQERPAWYRLLHEDPGCVVWTDGALRGFLEREYGRLFLAREIREVRDLGETRPGASIFSAEVHRERSEVVLRPLWPGSDLTANVERHVRFLGEEGFRNLLFELDMGVSWHASLVPVLLPRGFRPGMILPFAGRADLVVFQYHGTEP